MESATTTGKSALHMVATIYWWTINRLHD